MGRLIDTDAITDFMLEHNIPDSLFASVEEIVAYQPTAFNVEAVIDELEKILDGLSDGGDDWFTAEKINESIDIVRKGGMK